MTRTARQPQQPADARDLIVFSVSIISPGEPKPKFESELRLPFTSDPAEQQRAVEQWLDLMATGFRIGASSLCAELKEGAGA